jgi:uncharacterized RDD family membrane protein YckC
MPRILAGLTDLGIVSALYLIFIYATFNEMPEGFSLDKHVAGIYAVSFFTLVIIYLFLFMISASQTPGMKYRQLTVVTSESEICMLARVRLSHLDSSDPAGIHLDLH